MKDLEKPEIVWSEYFKYRAKLRGFSLTKIEKILRYSKEKYFDIITQRRIVIGKHDKSLVMIPYEKTANSVIPITIHKTTRQQMNLRLKSGRFRYE